MTDPNDPSTLSRPAALADLAAIEALAREVRMMLEQDSAGAPAFGVNEFVQLAAMRRTLERYKQNPSF